MCAVVHALTVCTPHIHAHLYDAPANATTFHTQILYTKHVQARNRVKPALHCTNECFIYDKYLFILFGAFSQSAFIQRLQQHLQPQKQRILQVHCIVVKFYIVTAARFSWWRIDNIYIFSLYIVIKSSCFCLHAVNSLIFIVLYIVQCFKLHNETRDKQKPVGLSCIANDSCESSMTIVLLMKFAMVGATLSYFFYSFFAGGFFFSLAVWEF